MNNFSALLAELAARARKQLGERGLKGAHDEPPKVSATPAIAPTTKAAKPAATASGFAASFSASAVDVRVLRQLPAVVHVRFSVRWWRVWRSLG